MAKKYTFEKAVAKYNEIMNDLCREYLTIGERLTEFPEEKAQWTIRDLVSECQYTLECYFEDGNANEELRHGDEYERKMWRSETGKLSRFINHYAPYCEGVKCFQRHCSKYDN